MFKWLLFDCFFSFTVVQVEYFDLVVGFFTIIQEYIHRVGRTARGEGARGSALLFLIPEELGFLAYLKVSLCFHVLFYL